MELGWRHGVRRMGFVRENVANPDVLPQGDFDADGLGDRWEVTHGFDPFTPGEGVLDPDKDGLINEDEYRSNTDPNDADTDNDGENDFVDLNRPTNEEDFVEIRLVTRDTGKINNGQNCAVCHNTQLKVGEFSHVSKRTNFSEKSFFFRKGTNYPIYLSELVQNLPPVSGSGGAPSTSATYTAAVLPATNQPPAFVVQDPQTRLGTNKPPSSLPPDPSVSIGSLIVPKIEVSWETTVGNTPLDTNSNAGGGLRIFPDALNPTATGFRNTVIVNVKTTPALPGQQVRLRSLDVDDPSSDSGGIIDTNDFFGFRNGNDNAGTPQVGQFSQTLLTLDSQGKAFAVFTTTTKPGDNFRIAAILETAGAQAHLNSLQTTNEFEQFYVSADSQPVIGFAGALSPMLTIWRKLHLEFDSMAAPPATGPETVFVNATLISATTNLPGLGLSIVRVRHTGGVGQDNVFELGKLEIPGFGVFPINKSKSEVRPGQPEFITFLEIAGNIGNVPTGTSLKLYDDDDRYLTNDPPLYPSSLNLQSPPLPALSFANSFVQSAQSNFASCYIVLTNANDAGWNPPSGQIIPFKRHAPVFTLTGSVFDAGNLGLKNVDRPEFWAFSVVFGYQSHFAFGGIPIGLTDDGDPDDEYPLLGGTPETNPRLPVGANTPFGYSVIFMENLRDDAFGTRGGLSPAPAAFTNATMAAFLAQQYQNRLKSVIAHEIGHAPGRQSENSDHDEEQIMRNGGALSLAAGFSPKTQRRFRTAESWTR